MDYPYDEIRWKEKGLLLKVLEFDKKEAKTPFM